MKILITGSTGLLGQALSAPLGRLGNVTGLSRRPPASGERHVTCDLRDARRAADVIGALAPEVVINTQALSDVDQCEQDPALAETMNVRTTAHLVQALAGTGALLVHVSTDYVFDGMKGTAYDETDAPRPVSVYGRSKLAGEELVLQYPRGIVVRTSTLFGPGRRNFCDHAVAQFQAGQPVEAFTDQVTSPTYTVDVAEAITDVSAALRRSWDPAGPRYVHVANTGSCSRVVFVERIAHLLRCDPTGIRRIPIAEQRRPARRPACSALTTIHLQPLIGRILRPWDDALRAYFRQRHWLN